MAAADDGAATRTAAAENPGAGGSGDRQPPHTGAPTVVDRPPRAPRARADGGPQQPAPPARAEIAPVAIGSPTEALRHDEIARSRRVARVGLSVALFAGVAGPLVTSSRLDASVVAASAVAAVIGNLLLLYMVADPARYTRANLLLSWELSCAGITAATWVVGVFSPTPMVMLLAVYFIGLGHDRRVALAVYLTLAVPQLGMGVAIIAGAVRDPGMITAVSLGRGAQVTLQVIVQMMLAWTYVLSRWSRQSMIDSVTELDRAARAIAKREAMLEEAREELERARGATGPGRFTGHQFGSYTLGPVLGRGGIGEVYEAAHVRTGAPAAVKLLRMSALGNPSLVKLFLREVEIVASLDVPNVVRVFEVGDESDPLPYLAMERLVGEDLGRILRRERQLEPGRAIDLVRQLGRGLSAAQQAGVVHRDLKPQNVFLTRKNSGDRGGVWKILDFGVAALLDRDGTATRGQIIGTPAYMAPEQARGRPVDYRADLHALAAIAYRALTGVPPFRGGDLPTVIYRVVHTMPVRPSRLAELPPPVDDVLLVGLAKAPRDRFEDATAFADALAAAFEERLAAPVRARANAVAATHPWAD